MEGLGIAANKMAPQVETSNAVVERAGFPTTNIQRAWLHLCQLRSMLFWTHIGIWSTEDSITSKIGPVIKSKDDITEAETPSDANEWTHSQSEESLTSTKNSDAEKDDMFDFESKSDLGREEPTTDTEGLADDENIETNRDVTLTEDNKECQSIKDAEEDLEETPIQKESNPVIPPQSLDPKASKELKKNEVNMEASKEEDSKEEAPKEEALHTPVVADTKDDELTAEDEPAKGDGNDDNSDAHSIDILNDYTEQEDSKESSTSPSNEDEFDDAQEHL